MNNKNILYSEINPYSEYHTNIPSFLFLMVFSKSTKTSDYPLIIVPFQHLNTFGAAQPTYFKVHCISRINYSYNGHRSKSLQQSIKISDWHNGSTEWNVKSVIQKPNPWTETSKERSKWRSEGVICKPGITGMGSCVFNSTLTELANKHAPLCQRRVTVRPRAPWYNDEIAAAKRLRRKLEHK